MPVMILEYWCLVILSGDKSCEVKASEGQHKRSEGPWEMLCEAFGKPAKCCLKHKFQETGVALWGKVFYLIFLIYIF